MQTEDYKRYIRSEAWRNKCKQRLIIANNRCEMCGKKAENTIMQYHHVTYKNLFHEDINNDIVALCGRCHILLHNYYNRKRG